MKKNQTKKQNKTVGLMFPGNGVYCFVEKRATGMIHYQYKQIFINSAIH